MFIEINLRKLQKILFNAYRLNYNNCNSDQEKKYMRSKLKHAYDCLNILRKSFPKEYKDYSSAILLHDIGRFYEHRYSEKFRHEEFGFEVLSQITNNAIILLPIRYHENDYNWKEMLEKDELYKFLDYEKKQQVINCCEILRDIDIISNMKSLIKKKNDKEVRNVNVQLIDKLDMGCLGNKGDINSKYDEIVYILCGLSIISHSESWKYIIKNGIVKKLIKRLFEFEQKNFKTQKYAERVRLIIKLKYGI